jgi:hypothetical protein
MFHQITQDQLVVNHLTLMMGAYVEHAHSLTLTGLEEYYLHHLSVVG